MKLIIKCDKGELGTIEKRRDGTLVVECKTPESEKELKEIIKEIKSKPVFVGSDVEKPLEKDRDKIYKNMIERIVYEMKYIIGDIAITQANIIDGLAVSMDDLVIKLEREPSDILEDLINRYEKIMGKTGVMLAKRAVRPILMQEKNLKVPEKIMV